MNETNPQQAVGAPLKRQVRPHSGDWMTVHEAERLAALWCAGQPLDDLPQWRTAMQVLARELSDTRAALKKATPDERDKWAKVLAESCDEFRSDMMGEAGSSGGCSRAVAAESDLAKLRTAALDALDVLDSYEAEAPAADRLRAALAGLGA